MHLCDCRESFLLKFIEIKMWEFMMKTCHLHVNHETLEMYLYLGGSSLLISELIFNDSYKISETNEFSTDIYIDLIKTYRNSSLFKLSHSDLVDYYFNTMEYLPYESTSKFHFHLINYSIRCATIKTFDINLREILNLSIAEGFSKLHTGYTNSKVTYNDLKEVCSFIIFKIKTQNFLDLALNENASVQSKPTLLQPTL